MPEVVLVLEVVAVEEVEEVVALLLPGGKRKREKHVMESVFSLCKNASSFKPRVIFL